MGCFINRQQAALKKAKTVKTNMQGVLNNDFPNGFCYPIEVCVRMSNTKIKLNEGKVKM